MMIYGGVSQVSYVCWGPAYQEVAQHLPVNGKQYSFASLIKIISIHRFSYFCFSNFLCILAREE